MAHVTARQYEQSVLDASRAWVASNEPEVPQQLFPSVAKPLPLELKITSLDQHLVSYGIALTPRGSSHAKGPTFDAESEYETDSDNEEEVEAVASDLRFEDMTPVQRLWHNHCEAMADGQDDGVTKNEGTGLFTSVLSKLSFRRKVSHSKVPTMAECPVRLTPAVFEQTKVAWETLVNVCGASIDDIFPSCHTSFADAAEGPLFEMSSTLLQHCCDQLASHEVSRGLSDEMVRSVVYQGYILSQLENTRLAIPPAQLRTKLNIDATSLHTQGIVTSPLAVSISGISPEFMRELGYSAKFLFNTLDMPIFSLTYWGPESARATAFDAPSLSLAQWAELGLDHVPIEKLYETTRQTILRGDRVANEIEKHRIDDIMTRFYVGVGWDSRDMVRVLGYESRGQVYQYTGYLPDLDPDLPTETLYYARHSRVK